MDLRGYVGALRKSWVLIIVLTLLGAALGFGAYLLQTPKYASTMTFYIATPVNPNENAQAAGQFAQNRVASYVQLLQSDRLSEAAATEARLPAADVVHKISASTQAGTVLVTATVTDTSPDRAQQIARGVAVAFPNLVDVLDNSGRQADVVQVNLTSGPTLTTHPVAPDLKLYLAVGAVSGLLVSILLALVRALLDQSVRSPELAASLLGAPTIGDIGYDTNAKRAPLLVGDAARSARAEDFRRLRTSLKFVDAVERTGILLVTSSTTQEGKSLTAANLAISLAEDGQEVLLVDADLRRPSVAPLLGLHPEAGLTSVLVDQLRVEEAIQEWGPHGLHVLTSGPLPPNPAELLGGDRMAELAKELRASYDKVVIDSPPVLPVADAAVLSSLADGVLFVVPYGRTSRSSIRLAGQSLASVRARILGGVLNMRKNSGADLDRGLYTSAWESSTSSRHRPAKD